MILLENKKIISLILRVMCILLSYGISVQIKTTNNIGTTRGTSAIENELRDKVLKEKEKFDNLFELVEKTEKELEKQRNGATKNNEELKQLENTITQGNKVLGLSEVTGSGIIVTLNDSQEILPSNYLGDPNDLLVHDVDIIRVVNELKNAGAEAISVNGQRIVTTSSIECVGSVIKINGTKVGAPFEIKAIGLQEALINVNRSAGYLSNMKEYWGLDVNVKKEDDIVIPKYTGLMKFQYGESK